MEVRMVAEFWAPFSWSQGDALNEVTANKTFRILLEVQQNWQMLDQGLSKHQEENSIPLTKVTKFIVIFLDLLVQKKVNPETKVQCGSYELLVSNVAHQIKKK